MTHDEIVAEIQARAERRGVLTHYCGSAERCHGDRGAPDLVLAGPHGVAWIEVKTGGDTMRPDQTTWKYQLLASGQEHYVIRVDVLDSVVDKLLDRLAGTDWPAGKLFTVTT